jgi:hypothetical protein
MNSSESLNQTDGAMQMRFNKWLEKLKSFNRKQQIITLTATGLVLVISLLLLCLLPGKGANARLELLPYNSNQGGFSINAPDGQLSMSQEKFLFLGKNLTRFIHQAKLPQATFNIIHFDMPPGVITPSERNNILNLLAAEFVAPVKGVVGTTGETMVGEYAGITISATGLVDEKEMIAEGIIVPVANRIYMAGVYGESGAIRQKQIKAFLSSLTFNF